MLPVILVPVVLALTLAVDAAHLSGARALRRASSTAYTDPTTGGGSMLTRISTSSSALGEPLNVIISALSDAQVLTADGLADYFDSLYFSPGDCFGISEGGAQQADLGDGKGYVNQTDVLRFNYYSGDDGTCLESLHGGNHLRYWIQNGSGADTGAVFIAASVEKNSSYNHDITQDGYDLGRDWLSGNATNATGTTSPATGTRYSTTTSQVSLLQGISTDRINHGISIDGNVDVLTVRISKTGSGSSSSSSSTSTSSATGSSVFTLHNPLLQSLVLLLTLCSALYSVM